MGENEENNLYAKWLTGDLSPEEKLLLQNNGDEETLKKITDAVDNWSLPDLKEETFQKIKAQLIVNSKAIKKININSASVDEMKSHPYIRYYIANAIFQYRKQHGNFQSVEEIKKIMTVTDDIYNKAFPYLTTD